MASNEKHGLSRRDFLKLTASGVAAASLAGLPIAAAAQSDSTTVVFWAPDCDTQCWSQWQRYIERYAEVNPNIQFETAGPPWGDYWQRTPLAIAGGRGPDIFYMHFFQTNPFVGGGLIETWPEERVEALRGQIAALDSYLFDGNLYYYPEGIQTSAIFYDKAAWEAAGLTDDDIPTTWEQLIELAKGLTETNSAGEVTRSGFEWGTNDLRWTWLMLKYQMGEFLFTPDFRRAYFNTEGGRAAAQTILDWEFEDRVGSTDLTPSPHEALVNGLAMMGFSYAWVARWFQDNHPDFEWGTFALPGMEEGTPPPVYDRGSPELLPGVNPQASDDMKQIGFDFIQWIGTDTENMKFRASLGVAPVLTSIQNDPEVLADPAVAVQLATLDRTLYTGAPLPQWEDDLKLITDLVHITRSTEIDEALQRAQEAVDSTLNATEFITWGASERAYAHADELTDPEFLS